MNEKKKEDLKIDVERKPSRRLRFRRKSRRRSSRRFVRKEMAVERKGDEKVIQTSQEESGRRCCTGNLA